MGTPSLSSEKLFNVFEKYQILFFFLVICLFRGTTLYLSVIDWDETAYVLVAREILNGSWPYSTVFDHKPIALYLHFAFFIGVFGDHPTAARLVSFFMVFGSAILLNIFLQKHVQVDFKSRLVLVVCFLLASSGFSGFASNSEHIINFYTLAWFLAILKALEGRKIYYALAGALMAISFHSNYLTGFILVGFSVGYLIFLLLTRENIKAVITECFYGGNLALCSFLISSVVLLAPIYLYGNLQEYFELQYAFITGYFPNGGSLWRLKYVLTYLAPLILMSLALGVFVLIQIIRYYKQGQITQQRLFQIALGILVLFIFFGCLYAAGASRRFYPHYFLLIFPTLILLFAISLKFLNLNVLKTRAFLLAILSSFVFVGSTSFETYKDGLRQYKRLAFQQEEVVDTERIVSQAVKPLLNDGEQIYVLCAKIVIYQLLDRRPPTKFGFFTHHFHRAYTEAFSTSVDAEVTKILQKKPGIVILGDFPLCKKDAQKADWLMVKDQLDKRGYEPLDEVKSHMIYRK